LLPEKLKNQIYLQRYAYPFELLKKEPVSDHLEMVVTIPCFNESNLIESLDSLYHCQKPICDVEVIVLINQSENVETEIHNKNEETFREATIWAKIHETKSMKFFIIWIKNLPGKYAGVGLARKIVMDESVRRFKKTGNPNGIIIGFDADSTCQDNFLVCIEKDFHKYNLNGGSINFEHPLTGFQDHRLFEGITSYELHLRYYIMAQKYAGFPYAFHTLGSSMAVRSHVYEKQGGMNKRKAGEDFYFLHKIIPLGNYKEINETKVIPSPRISFRVPFGTGKAMLNWMAKTNTDFLTYHPEIFEELKLLFIQVPDLYQYTSDKLTKFVKSLPDNIRIFLLNENFEKKITDFINHSSSSSTFYDKFFRWFNGLKLLQFVNFATGNSYQKVSIKEGITWLYTKYPIEKPLEDDAKELLKNIRAFNKNNPSSYFKS